MHPDRNTTSEIEEHRTMGNQQQPDRDQEHERRNQQQKEEERRRREGITKPQPSKDDQGE
jgi:hypothetical protein